MSRPSGEDAGVERGKGPDGAHRGEDAAAGGISIRGLTVRVGERTLLEKVHAEFPAGAVTLIVGASGTGKTVLLRILAGLLGPGERPFEVEGSVRIAGVEVLTRNGRAEDGRAATGIVFQNFALLDELSAAENIQLALDHRPRRARPGGTESDTSPAMLLEEFHLPARTPVSALSGGQKQRLAIARTLAYDPPVIIYDEPTSGLDPVNAARVATRIRETGAAHHKTTLVVTHDYERLASIADAVYVLDPDKKALVPLSPEAVLDLAGNLPGALRVREPDPPAPVPLAKRALGALLGASEMTGAAIEKGLGAILALLPAWRSPRWGLRYLVHYLGLIASPSSWLYFAAAGLIAGFVSTHFVFKFLPHKNYTEPLIADDLLNGLGFALYRILVPVLLTILLAARCGAAVASDIGNRVYTHQLDAMRSMGVKPARYLLTNVLLAFLIATPLLVGAGFLVARATSLAVYVFNYPEKGPDYWDGHFHRDLRIPGEWLYRGTAWLLAKVLLSGVGIGAIAYHVGLRPKQSGVAVSGGITSTIIWATLYVLLVHFIFAFVEF